MKLGKKWLGAFTLTVGLGILLAGCGSAGSGQSAPAGGTDTAASNQASTATTATTAAADKVYQVGTDAAYPPFEKMEGDKLTGFDMDVIQAVADAAGIKVELKHTGWDPLFNGIDTGTVDIGISAITITDERKQKYDFSEPYFEATQLIMVPEDSTVQKLADLQGKRIGVQSATTGEQVVKKAFGDTYDGLKGYDDTPSAVDELFNGRVDAVVADNAVLQDYVKKLTDKKFKLIKDDSFETENYGIMVKKGNAELLGKINEGLNKIKENGKLQEIHKQYFGE
ncbi:basic amino acid ABC transporter substrate-binding protein [Brevibacillus fulvus]|uniref:Polar amino acid transport system substrate-binding protein n=1 Tax=Brevibacillus fulvus TaxID=1125967 RepID=A0A938Y181_9BACL|nr:basic amino acid ABC transporter substrate-binding protein [Brevibacillus fulvus]MBM7591476.1 polar amino acid transport system substrate-binding protein [Brevibacillus fulvus]